MIFLSSNDDAKKLTVSHMVLTCSKQYLHNIKREDLTESTYVVPAKYPPKVKLELFITLECQSWGKLCVPWLVRVLVLLQQQMIDLFSLVQKYFPYRSIYEHILWFPFLVGVFLNMGHKIFSCIRMRGGQVQVILEPSLLCIPFSLMLLAFHLRPRLMPLAQSCRLHIAAICQWIQDRQVCLESSLHTSTSVSIFIILSLSIAPYSISLLV